ncbi:MAG TPA: Ig-like domain-containing protein [Gemmatimonadales bacterium]|nr:Ig-like domain-containing protein [Gemmatimonadales bacterium]
MRITKYFSLAPALLAASLQLALPDAGLAQKPVAEVQVAPPYVNLRVGATHRLSALAYDAGGNVIATGVRYAWSSNNVNVVRVDSTGFVTAVGVGIAVVSAEALGSGSPPRHGQAAIRVRRAGP